ncbi:translation factor Sua5, partial [Paenibacillus macerans]
VSQYPHIDEIKQTFLDGGLVAIPTETVYGLGANARNEEAVENIYVAKGRPSDNPLIVHIHSIEQLDDFVEYIDDKVKVLMDEFWPGPISFILPLKQGYLCSKVTGGLEPIAAPSANISGRPSPTTFEHVNRDLNGKVNGIVNGDQCEEGLESTVIDCTQFPFRIARPGSITQDMIETKLPHSINRQIYEENEKPIAPGMKYKHYSPETPLTIVKDLNKKIANDDKWSKVAFVFPESQR